MLENIKSAYAMTGKEDADRGDIVQTILLIAGFAIVTLAVVNWIGKAIMNKGADTAACIEGSSAYDGKTDDSADNCKKQNHASKNSFTNDSAYKSRY